MRRILFTGWGQVCKMMLRYCGFEKKAQMKKFGLAKEQHLRRKKEIERVFAESGSSADGHLVVRAVSNDLGYSRIVVSVSKKFGNSPQRNRIRRIVKEAFRLSKHDLPEGLDFAVLPRRGSQALSLEEARRSLHTLLWKANNELAAERTSESSA